MLRPFGTLSAKQRIPSLLFMLKSNKKPGTPPQWVPDPHRRSKRNKVPLGYPLPSSPFGQYKVPFRHGLPSILLAGCFLFSENFIVYCINVCRRSAPLFAPKPLFFPLFHAIVNRSMSLFYRAFGGINLWILK